MHPVSFIEQQSFCCQDRTRLTFRVPSDFIEQFRGKPSPPGKFFSRKRQKEYRNVFCPFHQKTMATSPVRIAGICGSLRKHSYNHYLLSAALQLAPEGMELQVISIRDLPFYNADQDIPEVAVRPEPVTIFRQHLEQADGILIASPEYNYSIPGVLKNAIDWASRGDDSPLLNKPVAVIGASSSTWGTVRMQVHFLSLFLYLDMQPVYKPEVLVAKAGDKFDETGRLTDGKTRLLLQEKLQELYNAVLSGKQSVTAGGRISTV